MQELSPVVAAHELGRRLRERRDALGLPASDVARAAGCSAQYLSQVETGRKVPAHERLLAFSSRLDFDKDEGDELVALRRRANDRGPLARYSGIFSAELLRFFGFEQGCESMHSFGHLVHGLLQTPDYARAVIASGGARIRQAEVERRVEARMLRQERLRRADPLHLSVVASELALRQQIGGPQVLARQLDHLVDRIEEHAPHVQVHIVPFTVTGHPALGVPVFHLLGFPSTRISDLVWVDTVPGMLSFDDPVAVHDFRLAHAAAVDAALPAVDSLRLIKEAARELE